MPPAARVTDPHVCPVHPARPVTTGASNVRVGHQPAARVGDAIGCGDAIVDGASNVMIGFQPAARMGDGTSSGGAIAAGCPNVLIGTTPQAIALATTAPLCAECEAARAARRRDAGQAGP
jgi:uncharacterized Zn-binding protein involved in type VI secretion